jgi:hypothetical protein
VPLYIGVAMGLAVSCQPRGTCYRCCLVLASTTTVAHSGVEAVVVHVAVVEVLVVGVHALAGEGFLLLIAALLGLLFLVQSAATLSEIFSQSPFVWPCALCHTPVLKEVNRSFHTCAQDVQITRMGNSKVNNSQCYDYNITRVYHLQNNPWV